MNNEMKKILAYDLYKALEQAEANGTQSLSIRDIKNLIDTCVAGDAEPEEKAPAAKQPEQPATPARVSFKDIDAADLILTFREEEGLTQAELSKLSGLTAANISKWETRKAAPSRKSMRKLLNAMEEYRKDPKI